MYGLPRSRIERPARLADSAFPIAMFTSAAGRNLWKLFAATPDFAYSCAAQPPPARRDIRPDERPHCSAQDMSKFPYATRLSNKLGRRHSTLPPLDLLPGSFSSATAPFAAGSLCAAIVTSKCATFWKVIFSPWCYWWLCRFLGHAGGQSSCGGCLLEKNVLLDSEDCKRWTDCQVVLTLVFSSSQLMVLTISGVCEGWGSYRGCVF